MLPSEIASIASAFSGVTATISLIYVGIQIRLACAILGLKSSKEPPLEPPASCWDK